MKLKDLCSYLDSEIPLSYQEDYDNSGLQIGLPESEISSALITLDITEDVLAEAVSEKCNIIISHHPLIFKGIKRIAGRTSAERIISKAVRHDIAIYSSHTNLDSFSHSVSRKMAEKLALKNIKVLSPLKNRLLKLVTYIPESYLDRVQEAVFGAGAGVTGNYDRCGFTSTGTGSFRGNENATPFIGKKGEIHLEKEIRFETVLFSHLKEKVIGALLEIHPYEEASYDIYCLENDNVDIGLGCVGELNEEMITEDFLSLVRTVFESNGLRYSGPESKNVRKVALCGGAGISLLDTAVASGADAFVTADIKYHSFLDADKRILLVDAGHFESEKFSIEILYDLIIKKFPKFAVRFSKKITNPINYL
jgi:dinuclear metal center YbgI/SA1388 family protein